MSAHSKLGASSYERWKTCPGSVRLCEGMPSIESDAAKEGTSAHEYLERFQRGTLPAEDFSKLPDEMQDAISIYAKTVFNDQYKKFPDPNNKSEIFIEHQFDLREVFPGCFGTADTVLWDPVLKILYVYDFKYGKGHFVEVENNLQLQYYALGALVTLRFPAKFVEIVVIQPRCQKKMGPVRRWRVPAWEMLDYRMELVADCEATRKPDAPLVPSRHCFWCPAHTKCPAKVAERLSKAIDVFSAIDDEEDPFS